MYIMVNMLRLDIIRVIFLPLLLFLIGCAPKGVLHAPTDRTDRSSSRYYTGHSWMGIASYYADKFHGRQTANGETYDMHGFTAAHKKLPFNTVLRVTYLKTGKSCEVRINDRGPFVRGREIDLTLGAAKKIGLAVDGVGKVRLKIIKLGKK